ncbi:MAG: CHASE3 domain-containing protein, partial [Pseudomonadota bacterium]
MPQPRPATPPWLPRADRLVVVAASLLILCIIALGVGVIWLANLQERGTQEGARVREIRSAVYDLSLKASDAELDRLVYILDGDARFLREGAIASQAMHDSLAHAHALTTFEPSLRERLERIALLIDRMDQRSAEVIAARRAGRLSARQIHDAAVELESLSDAMRVEFSPLLGAIETRVDRVRDRNAQGRASLYWLAGILIVLALSAAGVALFAIRAERSAWRSTLAI